MKKCKENKIKEIKVGIKYYNSVGNLLLITKVNDSTLEYVYVRDGIPAPIYSMWTRSWLKHVNNGVYAISECPTLKLYAIC